MSPKEFKIHRDGWDSTCPTNEKSKERAHNDIWILQVKCLPSTTITYAEVEQWQFSRLEVSNNSGLSDITCRDAVADMCSIRFLGLPLLLACRAPIRLHKEEAPPISRKQEQRMMTKSMIKVFTYLSIRS